MIESVDRPIGWKRPIIDQLVGGRLVSLEGDPSPLVLFWLHKDAIIERIEREIDAIADDANALTLEQRTEQVALISADKLATEREEEHFLIQAVVAGAAIQRRSAADPRAVLGLGDDMPPPIT
jgi:hypothetical protein